MKPQCDEPLSQFAFNFTFCRYHEARESAREFGSATELTATIEQLKFESSTAAANAVTVQEDMKRRAEAVEAEMAEILASLATDAAAAREELLKSAEAELEASRAELATLTASDSERQAQVTSLEQQVATLQV